MEFSNVYIEKANKQMAEYIEMINQQFIKQYNNILSKYGKFNFDLTSNTVNLFINDDEKSIKRLLVYNGEFCKYTETCFRYLYRDNRFVNDHTFELIEEYFADLNGSVYSLSQDFADVETKLIENRTDDYFNIAINSSNKVGFSLPVKYKDTIENRLACLFADFVITSGNEYRFVKYSQLGTLTKAYAKGDLSKELFKTGLVIYNTLKNLISPYISGEIKEERKRKNLCPECGGVLQGLFSKKCSVCGTKKGKSEKTNSNESKAVINNNEGNQTAGRYNPDNNSNTLAKINNLKRMIQAGGNFTFIAQNIATIYCAVKNTETGKTFNEHQILYATALFDLMGYIDDHDIEINEIADIVDEGLSKATLLPSQITNENLVGLAVVIENKCFELSTQVDRSIIKTQVEEHLESIAEVIETILKEPKQSSIYKDVMENVTSWMNNSLYIKHIVEYKNISTSFLKSNMNNILNSSNDNNSSTQDNQETCKESIEENSNILSAAVKTTEEIMKNNELNEGIKTNDERSIHAINGECDYIFCRRCGKKIPADSEFCTYCGTNVIHLNEKE